jgi:hypothetical protein
MLDMEIKENLRKMEVQVNQARKNYHGLKTAPVNSLKQALYSTTNDTLPMVRNRSFSLLFSFGKSI